MMLKRPRVVIIKAGFAGLQAARSLARASVEVQLLDRNNYHTFLPLLHQVATAELQPEQVAYPIRRVLRTLHNSEFKLTEVKGIDPKAQVVETTHGLLSYDFLIVAAGSTMQFLNVPGGADYAFLLKTLKQAMTLHDRILQCFEQAVQEDDTAKRQQLLTFVVVGGGLTGVEFAGALAEFIQRSLIKDYAMLRHHIRIVLLHSGVGLLAGLPKRLRQYAEARLKHRASGPHSAVTETRDSGNWFIGCKHA